MNEIRVIGLDLGKNVFHVVCIDALGQIVKRRKAHAGRCVHRTAHQLGILIQLGHHHPTALPVPAVRGSGDDDR